MTVFIAILITGAGTYLMRGGFIFLLAERQFPPLALRTLTYVAPAVMGALAMSMLTTPEGSIQIGVPEFAGLAVAAILAAKTRNHSVTLAGGLLVFWLCLWLI